MTAKRPKGLAALAMLSLALAGTMLALRSSRADPLPFDLPAPPPHITVGMLYNTYSSASSFYTAGGTKIGHTRISTDVPVLRVVKGFSVGGMAAAVQVIAPYVVFSGGQEIGGRQLTHNSGFVEPQLGGYIYPVNDPSADQYLVLSYLVSPPSGSFSPAATLNASTNDWVNEMTAGYGHVLLGQAHDGRRLDIELWGVARFQSGNSDFGTLATPFGTVRERLDTQPSGKLFVYLPYIFQPRTDGYVGLSLSQSFGGKQTVAFSPFPTGRVDTGNRTDATTVGVFGGSFLSRTIFAYSALTTDVRVRGGARNDASFTLVIGRLF
ncbi:transporter [Acidiphilium sp. C61]|jgi:hypothetical protein|uniref:transporter n=1 Tax=Acidiphilium sp. C61 TaxID=1671485 RepID=UPI00157AF13D|nr:transporter [Acidiphilium sp. C61]